MFTDDLEVREKARKDYVEYINNVMSADYGDFDLEVTHTCSQNEKEITTSADSLYNNCEAQTFRDARHKSLCYKVKGELMKCRKCGLQESPSVVLTNGVQQRQNTLLTVSHVDYPFTVKEEENLLEEEVQELVIKVLILYIQMQFY